MNYYHAMVYAKTKIGPREWDTNGSPNPGQKNRLSDD